MAAHSLIPVIHIFKEVNKGKYKSVSHFEIEEVKNGNSLLSDKLNLSKNRNFALSMPLYWLKIREGTKWSKCITGLFKTSKTNLFKGDHDKKKHLLLFEFTDNNETLKVFYFQNYFTTDLSKVLPQITE